MTVRTIAKVVELNLINDFRERLCLIVSDDKHIFVILTLLSFCTVLSD